MRRRRHPEGRALNWRNGSKRRARARKRGGLPLGRQGKPVSELAAKAPVAIVGLLSPASSIPTPRFRRVWHVVAAGEEPEQETLRLRPVMVKPATRQLAPSPPKRVTARWYRPVTATATVRVSSKPNGLCVRFMLCQFRAWRRTTDLSRATQNGFNTAAAVTPSLKISAFPRMSRRVAQRPRNALSQYTTTRTAICYSFFPAPPVLPARAWFRVANGRTVAIIGLALFGGPRVPVPWRAMPPASRACR
jgi:hypothetical protein